MRKGRKGNEGEELDSACLGRGGFLGRGVPVGKCALKPMRRVRAAGPDVMRGRAVAKQALYLKCRRSRRVHMLLFRLHITFN